MTKFPVMPLIAPRWDNAKLALIGNEAPRIPWDKFKVQEFVWASGEHVGLIGPTGQGKTTLELNILPMHPFVAVFATKPKDKTLDALVKTGYVKLDRWRSLDPTYYPRRIIWPDATKLAESDEIQRKAFADAMERIYREGNWTVVIDEAWYFTNVLGLGAYIKKYLLQARSLGISLVTATQRPAWVPVEIYSSSTHLFFWRNNDETDLQRLSGIGFRSAMLIREVVSNLDQYECLYINTRSGRMCRTKCPPVRFHKGGD